MYCRKCGKELPSGSNFCPNCGARQKEITTGFYNWIRSFYNNHKIVSCIYIAWLIFHIFLFLLANPRNGKYSFKRISSETIRDKFFPYNDYGVDSYDVSELFFYTIFLPFISYVLYKLLVRSIAYLRKLSSIIFGGIRNDSGANHDIKIESDANSKKLTEELYNSNNDIPLVSDNSKEEVVTEGTPELEAMPLVKRLLGSMIDKVVLLLFFFLTSEYNPFLKSGDLGGYIAILNESPFSYRLYEHYGVINGFEALDKRVTYSFILLNILFYVLFETYKKASLGKYLMGGVLIDSSSDKIEFGKALSRGLWGGFMMIFFYYFFHFMMGLNLCIVFCLFFLCIDLSVLFAKRSLLDICTGTIYAKR